MSSIDLDIDCQSTITIELIKHPITIDNSLSKEQIIII